jgi:uroporphyrinogen decarboxylase
MMKQKERIQRLLKGERVTPPLRALWKHFPIVDRIPRRFIDRTIAFQERFQWDFIKLNFNGLYSVEDWCPGVRWPSHELEVGVVEDFAIKQPKDWLVLEPLHPKHGALGRERYVTEAVLRRYQGTVPIIATIFSPLTTAIKMCGDPIFTHMKETPKELHRGLEVITQTTVAFVEELKKLGVDGFFFATQLADSERLTLPLYREFGTAYDLAVTETALRGTWFNVFHLHGMQPMFQLVSQYSFQAVNYHDRRCGIPLKKAREFTEAVLIGGLDEYGAIQKDQEEAVKRELRDALEQLPDAKLILGPGCVVPVGIPEDRFLWVSNFSG